MVNSDLVQQLMTADEDGSKSWRRDPKATAREIPTAHFLYKQHPFSTQPQCCLTFYSMGSSVIPCEFLVRSKIYGFLELITCEKQKNILSNFFRTFVHFTDQIRIDPKNGKKKSNISLMIANMNTRIDSDIVHYEPHRLM